MTAHHLQRSRCTDDLRWAHRTLQGPAATPGPDDQASLSSALGPSAWPHSAPPPHAAEGSALKCCSDPSSSWGPISGPRPWPAPCPAPGPTSRTAPTSPSMAASDYKLWRSRQPQPAPCARHRPLRAWKPGFTCKAAHPKPLLPECQGPWASRFAHHHHPEGKACLSACITPTLCLA